MGTGWISFNGNLSFAKLETQAFPPQVVRGLGHERWKQENNGWNDLTQNWSLKHGFLHACRHHPPAAATPDQPSQPVAQAVIAETSNAAAEGAENHEPQLIPNHGLAAVVLILMLTFTLCAAFTQCHSKLVRRYHLTGIEVARQLRVSVSKLPPRIRSPDSPAPQPRTI